MGRRIASREIVTLQLAEDFWIKVKQQLTFGEKKAIRKQLIRYGPEGPIVLDDAEEATTALMAESITEWNIEDEDGNVLPVTKEAVNALVDEDARLIVSALNKLYMGMEEEQKKA